MYSELLRDRAKRLMSIANASINNTDYYTALVLIYDAFHLYLSSVSKKSFENVLKSLMKSEGNEAKRRLLDQLRNGKICYKVDPKIVKEIYSIIVNIMVEIDKQSAEMELVLNN
ncbi:MAG: hypothetical protein QXF93_03200 [Saccharolobus sp.]